MNVGIRRRRNIDFSYWNVAPRNRTSGSERSSPGETLHCKSGSSRTCSAWASLREA